MRHFLRAKGVSSHPYPIAVLPFGVPVLSLTGGLITPSGVSYVTAN